MIGWEITESQYNSLTSHFGFNFGYTDSSKYYVDEYFLLNLESNNYDVESACQSLFLQSKDTIFPPLKNYKIYDYLLDKSKNKKEDPRSINYATETITRLHPYNTFTGGVLTKIVYYGAFNGTTYSHPVCEEEFVYTRDNANMATFRQQIVRWYYTDGTKSTLTKTLEKYYTPNESIVESKTRRENIINGLQLPIVGLIMQTSLVSQSTAILWGSTFMEDYQTEIISWINTPAKYAFQTRLNAEDQGSTNYIWLFNNIGGGNTIRSYILSQINY